MISLFCTYYNLVSFFFLSQRRLILTPLHTLQHAILHLVTWSSQTCYITAWHTLHLCFLTRGTFAGLTLQQQTANIWFASIPMCFLTPRLSSVCLPPACSLWQQPSPLGIDPAARFPLLPFITVAGTHLLRRGSRSPEEPLDFRTEGGGWGGACRACGEVMYMYVYK